MADYGEDWIGNGTAAQTWKEPGAYRYAKTTLMYFVPYLLSPFQGVPGVCGLLFPGV